MKRLPALLAALAVAATPTSPLAWGHTGHRMLGEAAMRGLPAEVPAFLRAPQAIIDAGEYSRERDRLKGSGRLADQNNSPAHFIDLDDDGKLLGGPMMLPLAATRAEYAAQLRAANLDEWKVGYLPYSILETWNALTTDFAHWRVLKAAEANPKWKAHRAYFTRDRIRREALILVRIGDLSHLVGDGSQPLHVSSHYNGWGDYPNPKGYTTARLHETFEGDLVRENVKPQDIKVAPLRVCDCPIEARVGDYLAATGKLVIPFYELEKAGGLKPGDPRGPAFAAARIGVGAAEVRDLIVEAWRASPNRSVGWRPIPVKDVLAGKVDPYPSLYGID